MCADTTPEFDTDRRGWSFRWPGSRLGERLMRSIVDRVRVGTLTIELPDGSYVSHRGELDGPEATLILNRWRAVRRLCFRGDIGFAEAYIDNDCTSPDMAALIELIARNQDDIDEKLRGGAVHRFINRWLHKYRANTEIGSRRNIIAHYDLGNDFYRLWLDPGMSYSSGLFAAEVATLEAAQQAKQDRALELLALQGGEQVLEIGIGWGGLVERLAKEKNARVSGITLSPSQLAYAEDRLKYRSLTADLQCLDYRKMEGKFDRIVSIEMFEAVGREFWPVYFGKLYDLLKPGGSAVLQVITIAEERFESYFRYPDFIQRSVFPGGMLPSPTLLKQEIDDAKLRLSHEETFGLSYAKTLAEWRRRFERSWPDVAALGFPDRFKRLWQYYLSYCEGGFRSGNINVGLYRIERPA